MERKNYTWRQIYRMVNMYNSGLSCTEIADIIGCERSGVFYALKRENVKMRDKRLASKIHTVNESFFSNIDNEPKAYFLGLLFADGCNYRKDKKQYIVSLSLKEEDGYLVDLFSKEIEYSGLVKIVDMQKYSSRNAQNQKRIQIYNKPISDKLFEIGCTNKKSFTLQFPNVVPIKLMRHFLRGYFDGDGSIQNRGKSSRMQIYSTKDFLKSYLVELNKIITTTAEISFHSGCYAIEIGGRSNLKKIYNYFYNDCKFYLKRKQEIFNSI